MKLFTRQFPITLLLMLFMLSLPVLAILGGIDLLNKSAEYQKTHPSSYELTRPLIGKTIKSIRDDDRRVIITFTDDSQIEVYPTNAKDSFINIAVKN